MPFVTQSPVSMFAGESFHALVANNVPPAAVLGPSIQMLKFTYAEAVTVTAVVVSEAGHTLAGFGAREMVPLGVAGQRLSDGAAFEHVPSHCMVPSPIPQAFRLQESPSLGTQTGFSGVIVKEVQGPQLLFSFDSSIKPLGAYDERSAQARRRCCPAGTLPQLAVVTVADPPEASAGASVPSYVPSMEPLLPMSTWNRVGAVRTVDAAPSFSITVVRVGVDPSYIGAG